MKTKNIFKAMLLSGAVILSSCSSDDPDPVACVVDAPMTYEFSHEGASTVSYSGQAGRLETAKLVYNALNAAEGSATIDRTALDLIIDNGNSKLITKTAENDVNRSHIIDDLNSILDTYCANSATYDLGTVAVEGVAGWKGSYQVDARGWEGDQQFAKMLIGALCLEQVNYDYLTKMDVDNEDRTYSNFTDGVPNGNNNVYTKREHYYDEAYGYVYGLDDSDLDADINNGLLLGKYLNKHSAGNSYSGVDYRQRVYDAFKKGRQAVVDNCQEELDLQITEINNCLSKVVAWHAQNYLTSAAGALGTDDFFHDVSEAWGFVYSLQWTKVDGAPLFSHIQVETMLETLDSGTGAWSLSAETLNNMATDINNTVTFD